MRRDRGGLLRRWSVRIWADCATALADGIAVLRTYRLRSALTIGGVAVGVGSIVAMTALIAGLDGAIQALIRDLGSAAIYVRAIGEGETLSPGERERRVPLTPGEVEALRGQCPAVAAMAPVEYGTLPLAGRGQDLGDTRIVLTTHEFADLHGLTPARGRFLTPSDTRLGRRVAVLGPEVSERLFGPGDPTGEYIDLDGLDFEVVGVLEPSGIPSGLGRDDLVLLPQGALVSGAVGELGVDAVAISEADVDRAVEEMTLVLRRQRRIPFGEADTFGITTEAAMQDLYRQMFGGLYLAMFFVSSLALLVGGVGLTNILLYSVTERTREIGIRRAVGARKGDIVRQFLAEAVALSGSGGIVGLIIGTGAVVTLQGRVTLPMQLQPLWGGIALGISVVTGLVFGAWPAARAAECDPVEALAHE